MIFLSHDFALARTASSCRHAPRHLDSEGT